MNHSLLLGNFRVANRDAIRTVDNPTMSEEGQENSHTNEMTALNIFALSWKIRSAQLGSSYLMGMGHHI